VRSSPEGVREEELKHNNSKRAFDSKLRNSTDAAAMREFTETGAEYEYTV
jgi:hypothetical protein